MLRFAVLASVLATVSCGNKESSPTPENPARTTAEGTPAMASSDHDVQDLAERQTSLTRYRADHQLVAGGPNDMVLQVSKGNWPLPNPLAKVRGLWSFDGASGADAILRQRFGGNDPQLFSQGGSARGGARNYSVDGKRNQGLVAIQQINPDSFWVPIVREL